MTNNDILLLQQRLTDLQRQYTVLEAQNTEMQRKLWNMEKTADNGGKNGENVIGMSAKKDPLSVSRDIDLQSTISENAENQSILSATAEDFNQTEFASSAPSSSPKSRQPVTSISTQSTAMYDLRKNGTSTIGSVAGTSSSSSVGSGINYPNPTPNNNTTTKSITGSSVASDPIGTFLNMFGHGSG